MLNLSGGMAGVGVDAGPEDEHALSPEEPEVETSPVLIAQGIFVLVAPWARIANTANGH